MSEVSNVVVQVNAVMLQEGVDFHTGFETEHLAHGGLRETFRAVAFESQCFQGYTGRVLSFGRDLPRELVWNIERDLHRERIARKRRLRLKALRKPRCATEALTQCRSNARALRMVHSAAKGQQSGKPPYAA